VSDPATPNELKRPHLEVQYEDPVEAGCKAIVVQRAKQSGMHWTTGGAASIIALRTLHASGRWDELWATHAASRAGLQAAI
jgi:hypothetical protein